MADLAELTGAGRLEVFPGYKLAPLDMLDYGDCEKEFEAKHIAFAKFAADGQHPEAAEKIVGRAFQEVEAGRFAFGTSSFDGEALKAQNLPLLAWLGLKHNHPDITRQKVGELIRAAEDPATVQDIVLANAGYQFKKKPTTPPDADTHPTGTQSSPPSESSASDTATSEPSPSASLCTPSDSAAEVPPDAPPRS